MNLYLDTYESAIGQILLVSDGKNLVALDYADYEPRMRRLLQLRHGAVHLSLGSCPTEIKDRLHAYFAGDLFSLEGIPVFTGGTAFQRQVWDSLREITPGKTRSYGEIAQRLGRVNSSRAVGAANGANPIAIVIPCHRVIGSSGSLTGYAGGLERKEWLLHHERS
jgi:methylated-DNA-[protein]-cysteine S-methyltransferase